jgi:hypothetical protein
MKPVTFFLAFIAAVSLIFIACDKTDTTTLPTANTNCVDTAFLLPDSLSCSGKNYFVVGSRKAAIAVSTGNVAIDTVSGGAYFYITYSSSSGTSNCNGVAWQNAALSCFQRK